MTYEPHPEGLNMAGQNQGYYTFVGMIAIQRSFFFQSLRMGVHQGIVVLTQKITSNWRCDKETGRFVALARWGLTLPDKSIGYRHPWSGS